MVNGFCLSVIVFIMLAFNRCIKMRCISSSLSCFNRGSVFCVRSSSRRSNKSLSNHRRSHHSARHRSRTRSRSRSGSADRKHRRSRRSSRRRSESTTQRCSPGVEISGKHHHHKKKKAKRTPSTSHRQRDLTPASSDTSPSVDTSLQQPAVSTHEQRLVTLSSPSST